MYLIPEELPYELTVIEGVIVDILKNIAVPDLACEGTLEWNDVTPYDTVTGGFTVSNIGEADSNLDWKSPNGQPGENGALPPRMETTSNQKQDQPRLP